MATRSGSNKWKRRKFNPSNRIYREVDKVVEPYGCRMVAFTESAVAVKGDDREYGPGVVIQVPEGMSQEKIGEVSTRITNEVRGVTRVAYVVKPVRPIE